VGAWQKAAAGTVPACPELKQVTVSLRAKANFLVRGSSDVGLEPTLRPGMQQHRLATGYSSPHALACGRRSSDATTAREFAKRSSVRYGDAPATRIYLQRFAPSLWRG